MYGSSAGYDNYDDYDDCGGHDEYYDGSNNNDDNSNGGSYVLSSNYTNIKGKCDYSDDHHDDNYNNSRSNRNRGRRDNTDKYNAKSEFGRLGKCVCLYAVKVYVCCRGSDNYKINICCFLPRSDEENLKS